MVATIAAANDEVRRLVARSFDEGTVARVLAGWVENAVHLRGALLARDRPIQKNGAVRR